MSTKDRLQHSDLTSDKRADGIAQWIPEWFPDSPPHQGDGFATEAPTTVYAVILHDDEVHTCRDFVEILEQVFGYSEPAAYSLTQEIAKAGRTIIWKGFRDEAERKAQQARTYQPRWRREKSITAPQRVSETVDPCTLTVVLATDAVESDQSA